MAPPPLENAMLRRFAFRFSLIVLGALLGFLTTARSAPEGPSVGDDGSVLITVILRHDQSKTLQEIEQRLEATRFWDAFPPNGVKVERWDVVMGLGQVVTLRVPPDRLRDVNLAIEQRAWGAFRTEFYPTYDYLPVWREKTLPRQPAEAQR